MNSALKKNLKKIIRVSFRVAPGPSEKVWEGVCWFLFRNERLAYKGKIGGPGEGDLKSVVFFSHNRCASMMLNRRIQELIPDDAYQTVDYQRFVHSWNENEREAFRWDQEGHSQFQRFRERGFFYGVFRYFVDVPNLDKMHKILVLRDPRDVITSRYFSEAFAHVALDKKFHEHTEKVRRMELDTFVRTYAKDVDQHYRDYMANFEKLKNGVVWRYEDLIENFEGFLCDVNEKCDFERCDEEVAAIASRNLSVFRTKTILPTNGR